MIMALVNKRHKMQEQVVNGSRETEMLRKNQKELLEIFLKKNRIIELKNAFEEFVSRMHTAEERISELKGNTIEHFKTAKPTNKQKNPKPTTEQNIQELRDNYEKYKICIMGIQEEEKDKRTEELFEAIMTQNFPKINV